MHNYKKLQRRVIPGSVLYASGTTNISFVPIKRLFNGFIKHPIFARYIKSLTKMRNTSDEGEKLLVNDSLKTIDVDGDLSIKSDDKTVRISYTNTYKYINKHLIRPFISENLTVLVNKEYRLYIKGHNFVTDTKLDIEGVKYTYKVLSPVKIELKIDTHNVDIGKYKIILSNNGIINNYEGDDGYVIVEGTFSPLHVEKIECWYNENSIKSNPVNMLYDQSDNDNDAFQKKKKLQPNFNKELKCLELIGATEDNEKGHYFRLPDLSIQTLFIVISGITKSGIHGILGKKFFMPYTYLHIDQKKGLISFDGMSDSKGSVYINGDWKGLGKDVEVGVLSKEKLILVMEYKKLEHNWKQLFTFTNENHHKSYRANVNVHEIIAYKKKLNPTERRKIEVYLSYKWDIPLQPVNEFVKQLSKSNIL